VWSCRFVYAWCRSVSLAPCFVNLSWGASRGSQKEPFTATTIVEALITIAQTAGANVIPALANAPAASG
jgi:hypothetical protein